jgi:cysteine-rich repeat protein
MRSRGTLGGRFTHGLAAAAMVHDSLGRNRAFYGLGYELAVRGTPTLAPYAVVGTAVGLSTDAKQALAMLWSVGVGVSWQPASWFGLAVEGRYRAEDRGPRGFWRLRDDARDGLGVSAGLAVAFGGGRGRRGRGYQPVERPDRISGNAADVVRMALESLGTPYRWGGTAENGFDCSGLIQYAYASYGVRLPRTSREQARSGSVVPPVVDALQPGDVLLFAADPGGGVTHVGMYVGESKFIHSSSSGGVITNLPVPDEWSLTLTPTFSPGITEWVWINGDNQILTLMSGQPLTLSANATPAVCRVDCSRPECGDGVLDGGEVCDDGNTNGGDGCPGNCR